MDKAMFGISDAQAVLIVPLWNWNEGMAEAAKEVKKSSNRTFMELKCWCGSESTIRRRQF